MRHCGEDGWFFASQIQLKRTAHDQGSVPGDACKAEVVHTEKALSLGSRWIWATRFSCYVVSASAFAYERRRETAFFCASRDCQLQRAADRQQEAALFDDGWFGPVPGMY